MANELIEKQQEDKFEPIARILAANAVAQSLSFTMERKYLEGIDSSKDVFPLLPKNLSSLFKITSLVCFAFS